MQPIVLGNLTLHPIEEGDIDLLHKWLNAPHVAEWFDGAVSLEAVQRKYIEKIRSDWQQAFMSTRPTFLSDTFRVTAQAELGLDGGRMLMNKPLVLISLSASCLFSGAEWERSWCANSLAGCLRS